MNDEEIDRVLVVSLLVEPTPWFAQRVMREVFTAEQVRKRKSLWPWVYVGAGSCVAVAGIALLCSMAGAALNRPGLDLAPSIAGGADLVLALAVSCVGILGRWILKPRGGEL